MDNLAKVIKITIEPIKYGKSVATVRRLKKKNSLTTLKSFPPGQGPDSIQAKQIDN